MRAPQIPPVAGPAGARAKPVSCPSRRTYRQSAGAAWNENPSQFGAWLGRKLDARASEIAIDAAPGVDQDSQSFLAVVFAASWAAFGNHLFGQIAGLQVLLSGAVRNQPVHFFRQRLDRNRCRIRHWRTSFSQDTGFAQLSSSRLSVSPEGRSIIGTATGTR